MALTCLSRNIVCVFDALVNKRLIDLAKLVSLVPHETPEVDVISQTGAPMRLTYPESGIRVLVVENRLQLDMDGHEDTPLTRVFTEVARIVVAAFGDQQVKAYGFNWDFTFTGEPIAKLLGLRNEVGAYQLVQGTGVQLKYRKNNVEYSLSLADGPETVAHINVHHQMVVSPVSLANDVERIYAEDFRSSVELLEEVVEHGA